ncbi:hypothetical protein [Cohnella cholangitidis]|uniref:Uncharacterized protein n=1 Tax=Cohnella cholangitidis TaxID=2598458 RepID=A0A7G5C2C8_9BACL|nr:hypothetical protein [Cohnella cholangitidis]QMV43362.1 hypothetical protein FPL14_20935 [Cohnella cholangitidis]
MKARKERRERPSGDRRKQGAEGSVTIYFIAATAAFMLLTALLIDFARVAAFRKQAELAVKSGARSTLSSFDPTIYARYGLFIRGGEPANELFRETLEGNTATGGNGAFTLLDTRWETTEVTESRPLATHDVFRRQILEEMKYKAPIDLALEVASRFRGVSGAMKEAATTVDLLEKMRKAYDRRERAFDEALNGQKKQGTTVQQMVASEIGSMGGVIGSYDDYVIKRLDDEARRKSVQSWEEEQRIREENGEEPEDEANKPEGPRYEAEVAAYEANARNLSVSLSESAASIKAETDKFVREAIEAVTRAKSANDEMRAIIEQANSMPDTTSGQSGEEGAEVAKEHIETMKQLRKSAEDLVLKPEFFDRYFDEIRLQHTKALMLASEAAACSSLVASVPGSTGMRPSLQSGQSRLQSAFDDFSGAYGSGGAIISSRISTLEAHRSRDNERKQEEEKAKTAWSGATNFLDSLSGRSGSAEEKEAFERTSALYASNREWNQTEEEHAESAQASDPSEGRDAAMSSSSGLIDVLEDSLLGARDQLFFSEYSMSRLAHFDPGFVKTMLGGGDVSLDIHMQEAEYILYGLNNPAGNIAAAYGEIFAFRLAVRTMEGLIECRAMGHPLLVLAAALVYGITKALLDLNLLINTGKVQLSKYMKVDTYYTDYLRLFMLLHGGSANQMARMIALMEHASDLDFSKTYTYASGEGSASIRLWFFPGLLKVMGRFGDLGGTVKGNRYEATYNADSSYQ